MYQHRIMISIIVLVFVICNMERTNGQIPLSMWVKLKNVNATKFIDEFLRQSENVTTPAPSTEPGTGEARPTAPPIFTRGGSISPEGRDSMVKTLAGSDPCSPREETVSTITVDDPNLITWPPCTKLPRCGGCCGHDMLECAPSKVEMHEVMVLRARYPHPGATQFVFEGQTTVSLEKHLECSVRCKVQPYHCNEKQRYEKNSCKCRCLNEQQSGSCTLEQRWDPEKCACVCRKEYYCHDDEIFSNSSCKCELKNDIKSIDRAENGQSPGQIQVNPCADVYCRRGYVATQMGSSCKCKLDARYGINTDEDSDSRNLDRMTLDRIYPRRDHSRDDGYYRRRPVLDIRRGRRYRK